jgi:hypothetical protein
MKRHQCLAAQTASPRSPALQLPLDFSAPISTPSALASGRHHSRAETSADIHFSPCARDSGQLKASTYAGMDAKRAGAPSSERLLSRFVRFRDAPAFFGMNKNLFNREVRPHLTEIRIGRQGRAFDRLEMEASAEEYRSRNGRPAAARSKPWDKTEGECQDSSDVVECGTSTRLSTERAFAKALEHATSRKRKHC